MELTQLKCCARYTLNQCSCRCIGGYSWLMSCVSQVDELIKISHRNGSSKYPIKMSHQNVCTFCNFCTFYNFCNFCNSCTFCNFFTFFTFCTFCNFFTFSISCIICNICVICSICIICTTKKALAGQTMTWESIWTKMVPKGSIHKKNSQKGWKTGFKKANNGQKRFKTIKGGQKRSTIVKNGQYS